MAKKEMDFTNIVLLIDAHRKSTFKKINEELVSMCWEIGEILFKKLESKEWGDRTIASLSTFIQTQYPSLKGFSRAGLYRMKQFYETYRDNVIVSPLVRQISWTNNMLILSHKSLTEEKEFYILTTF